uniref:Uncharacterized protein n=1 Tax=Anguilla anguilla TaxID=7936 RepID=A0A0E9VW78_ANGAN
MRAVRVELGQAAFPLTAVITTLRLGSLS